MSTVSTRTPARPRPEPIPRSILGLTRAEVCAAVLAVVGLAVTSAGHAQSCSTPVDHWTGTYSITGNGSSACVDSDAQCVTNESAKGSVRMAFNGVNCSTAAWSSQPFDPRLTISVNDTLTAACTEGGPTIETVNGVGPDSSESTLTVNESAGNYTYWPLPLAIVSDSVITCDGQQVTSPPGGGYGLSGVPPLMFTFSLPASVRTLSNSATVPSRANGDGLATFKLTFSLEPHYHTDDDCPKNGNSTLGCMNQTLGEDVPITGTEFSLHYDSARTLASGANTLVTTYTAMLGGWTLSAHHAYDPGRNVLYLGAGGQRNSWRMGAPLTANGSYLLTAEDGSEVYVFDVNSGRHTQTRWPLTGALRYQFGYDAAGNLTSVTDASGNITSIQRDASEQVTAIVSPYGVTTKLHLAGNGFLKTITDPAGNKVTLTTGTTGLITARTDANGVTFNYSYDLFGGLLQDTDPLGTTALARTAAPGTLGQTIAHTTPLGRTTRYQTSMTVPWTEGPGSTITEAQNVTWPDGLISTSNVGAQAGHLTRSVALPDGTGESATLGPDAHWGLQAPFAQQATIAMGSLSASLTSTTAATLANPSDPFSLLTQSASTTINSRTYSSAYSAASATITNTTPAGRIRTQTIDNLERVTSIVDGNQSAVRFTYDAQGRVHSVVRGVRRITFGYDSHGYMSSTNNALAQRTSYKYDGAGRLTSLTAPDSGVAAYQYDGNGNVTGVTPPGQPLHAFAYNQVNLLTKYTPPSLAGTGPTTYEFNADRDLTRINRPDGGAVNFAYDMAGRLSSITTPSVTLNYQFDAVTGNVTNESIGGGESLSYVYDGAMIASESYGGPITGTVQTTRDNNGWVVSESVNSGSTIAVSYDADGLPSQVGALTIKRSPSTGLPTSTKLGAAADTRTYSALGDLASYSATYGGQVLYSLALTRDNVGRIASRTETIGGVAHNFAYEYDPVGRLSKVSVDGVVTATYTYDGNGNRLSATGSSGTLTAIHDVQDRLTSYGATSYTYTANGELLNRITGSGTTSYTYDALGNLLSVQLAGGSTVTYVVDAENRRVGKRLNGSAVTGYLYSAGRLVAQLNGGNSLIGRFVYGTSDVVPDYMVKSGVTYRIFTDPLGSPRLVVNVSNGQIAQRIDYDEFGNVTSDSAPGFTPFGFAGGLYDSDTGLVRLGVRDYDPTPGRFTAKDPWLFAGDDTNLYAYAGNDPINYSDPSGLDPRCKACSQKKELTVKDVVDIAKKANKLRKGDPVQAVTKSVGKEAKKESPMSGSGSEDYKRATQEVEKSKPFIEKQVNSAKEVGSTCIVQLQGGDSSQSDSSKPKNQPPVPRGDPPPKWTPTQAARVGAQIGSGY